MNQHQIKGLASTNRFKPWPSPAIAQRAARLPIRWASPTAFGSSDRSRESIFWKAPHQSFEIKLRNLSNPERGIGAFSHLSVSKGRICQRLTGQLTASSKLVRIDNWLTKRGGEHDQWKPDSHGRRWGHRP